jgi:hypothetical protein
MSSILDGSLLRNGPATSFSVMIVDGHGPIIRMQRLPHVRRQIVRTWQLISFGIRPWRLLGVLVEPRSISPGEKCARSRRTCSLTPPSVASRSTRFSSTVRPN